ncbi:MAG: hypothetical protein HYV07_04855 [Deltaproteobacteria bacterium]|nr:hypothetical protein [Deltaproteobacteria bacterium]
MHDQIRSPSLELWPSDLDAAQYIRGADLEFLTKEAAENKDSPLGSLGAALTSALLPAAKAVQEASAKFRECEVVSAVKATNTATITLKQVSRRPANLEVPAAFGELAKLDSHEARVALARGWFESTKTTTTSIQRVRFVKTEGGWRANFFLPEAAEARAKAEAKKAKVKELLEKASALMDRMRVAEAKATVAEAVRVDPENVEARENLKAFEEGMQVVAGLWLQQESKDPMTDDANVVSLLPSDDEISKSFGKATPVLVARCAEKRLSLYINMHTSIDSDYGEIYTATGRFRFGSEPAQRIRFGIADSHDAVFFPNERSWIKSLKERSGDKLVVEVPTYGTGPQAFAFTLSGADVALKPIESCPN